jgi:branched-chain amino acid transport system ATP-binding protein
MGADEEVANTAQRPPSLGEGMRIAWNVRTMRRILFALPFLVGSSLGILQLLGFYFQDVYNLGPAARGTLASLHEGAAIPGVLLGGAVATRLLRDRPSRVITYGGVMAVFTGIAYGVLAFSPSLPLAVAFMIIGGFAGAILAPATTALITLVVPARARGIGLSLLVIFVIPGVIPLFFIGQYADDHGVQQSMLLLTPLFIIGALILTSAGSSVDADIRSATAAAMAAEESRQSKAAGAAKLLVVRDLDVGYDDVQILFNVDFDVEEGEIIALLGTNGAGKSTLLRAISGLAVPWNGAVFYDGEDITYLPANEHAGRGIIQTPGGRGVFTGLTVAENLRVAAWMFRSDDAYVAEATETVLTYFPRLRERLDQPAGNLSGGEQQMLTLSQAFLSRPRLLMIDELSLGLSPLIVEQLLGIVRAIAERGTTIVLVEQSVNVALTIANKAVFMEKGEIKFQGSTADLLQRPDILRSVYLRGSSTATGLILSGKQTSVLEGAQVETALELRGVRKHWGGVQAINGVSFAVPEGQTLGLIGPNGAGKTTIYDIISGFVEPDEGEVLLFGEPMSELTPDDRARLGLHRSFQDARLFPSLTVAENIAVALERHVEARSTTMAALHLPGVKRSETKLARRVERLVDLLNLGDFRDKFVRELSTGSRRLVDLACVMAADPRVLLLDEPSAGIAQKEAEELGPLLQRIKYETGATMLIIEHDMPLIMSVSDELLALEVGTVITRGLPHDVVANEQVIASYLGTSEEAINRSGNN